MPAEGLQLEHALRSLRGRRPRQPAAAILAEGMLLDEGQPTPGREPFVLQAIHWDVFDFVLRPVSVEIS